MKELSLEKMESIFGGMTWDDVVNWINEFWNWSQYDMIFTNMGNGNWEMNGYALNM